MMGDCMRRAKLVSGKMMESVIGSVIESVKVEAG